MEYGPTGVKVGGTSDTILILGVLGVAGVILWKTGLFDTIFKASKVADTALTAANTVATDVANLPENTITGISDVAQIAQTGVANSSTAEKVIEAVVPAVALVQGVASIEYSISHPVTELSIFNDAIKGGTIPKKDGISQMCATMIYSVYHRYASVNCYNWSAMAIVNGAKFSSTGTITGDNTISLGKPQLYPTAVA